TVRVIDMQPPNFFCTSNKTVECGTSWTFNQPTAFDNCNATGVTVVVTGTITNPICGGSYTATRSWRATDSFSNSAFCSQTVTVIDTTPPVVNCPTNFAVQCGTAWNFGIPNGVDACSGQSFTTIITGTSTNALCGRTYSATRNFLILDGCSNATPCSQTVTVFDTT